MQDEFNSLDEASAKIHVLGPRGSKLSLVTKSNEGVRIKLLPYTNFYLEVYGTK